MPVPQTDTGGQEENSKASGRRVVDVYKRQAKRFRVRFRQVLQKLRQAESHFRLSKLSLTATTHSIRVCFHTQRGTASCKKKAWTTKTR